MPNKSVHFGKHNAEKDLSHYIIYKKGRASNKLNSVDSLNIKSYNRTNFENGLHEMAHFVRHTC